MGNFIDILRKRRSIYNLSEDVELSNEEIIYLVEDVLKYSPSHMNKESTKLVLLLDDKSKEFWTKVNKTYDDSINSEKFNGFYHAKGTVLVFIDEDDRIELEEQYPLYKDNFLQWSEHSSAIIQINLWNAFSDENIGMSVQHYNPGIDKWVKEDYKLKDTLRLVAQMPFGKIIGTPEPKEKKRAEEVLKVIK